MVEAPKDSAIFGIILENAVIKTAYLPTKDYQFANIMVTETRNLFTHEAKYIFFGQHSTVLTTTDSIAKYVTTTTDNSSPLTTKGYSFISSTTANSVLGTTTTGSVGFVEKSLDGVGIWSNWKENIL